MAPTPGPEARREGLARAIKVLRVERGLSRTELAELAEVSYSHLAEIENARKEPSPGRFADIAQALGVSRSDLVALAEAYTEGEEPVVAEATREHVLPRRQPDTSRTPGGRPRSFVLPLMGGEWEAGPDAEPSRTAPVAAPEPPREDRRVSIGELLLTASELPADDLRRLLQFARDLRR
ncbi:MAG TPA: helix-turn-helix transcriptional regulator [Actinomycetota bacterium]|nr:helix-turn-helix transcriptional regulator [Actinomycetota bacterium]